MVTDARLFRRRYPQVNCPGCGGSYPDYRPIGCEQPPRCLRCEISRRLRERQQ